jgi:2-keto-4-pentenoate hydratase/2-oxohepta-3-ene-1,7-dioic acid hydratase in catechol pathway
VSRLVTCSSSDRGPWAGLVLGNRVLDLQAAFELVPGAGPVPVAAPAAARGAGLTMRSVLGRAELDAELARIEAWVLADGAMAVLADRGASPLALADVRLHAPVPDPAKIIGVGLNYISHADEAASEVPQYPMLFAKFGNTVAGPYDPIRIPRVSKRIDYEGELVAVIGRGGRYIPESEAMAHVAGFTVGNDVSARDYQFRTKEMLSGKTFDGFAPMGPWLTTTDEVGDLAPVGLRTFVGGEQRQSTTIDQMVFSVAKLVSYISDIATLEPGDVIFTGTPGGIGATLTPRRWLRPGDEVVVEIDRIGAIRNVVEEGAAE